MSMTDSGFELVIVEGVDSGTRLRLPACRLHVGRGDITAVRGDRIWLAEPSVSRDQAVLSWGDGGFTLEHLEAATNLTRVDGASAARLRLLEGSVVSMGRLAMRLERLPVEPKPVPKPEPGTRSWSMPASYYVRVIAGPDAGRKVRIAALVEGRVIRVGGPAGGPADVQLTDAAADAQIGLAWREGRFWLARPGRNEVPLRLGEEVTLGATRFMVVDASAPADAYAPVTLEVIAGVDEGRRFPLTSDAVRVGRDASCDVVLGDPSVSRHHITVCPRDDAWWLTPESRTNPTLVNGVEADRDRLLAHGDEIRLSPETVLRLSVRALEIFD